MQRSRIELEPQCLIPAGADVDDDNEERDMMIMNMMLVVVVVMVIMPESLIAARGDHLKFLHDFDGGDAR